MKWFQALALLVALTFVPGARAISKPAQLASGKKAAILAELKATKRLLERANHDYAGHRAKAVHEITAAIHHLEGHHQQAKPHLLNATRSAPHVHASGRRMTEPQPASDAQLRQAVGLLVSVKKQLGGSHPKAQGAVAAAIRELHTALKIR